MSFPEADFDETDKAADDDEGGVRTEEELTSINSMMSTVMNVGQINGVDSETPKTSPRNTSKSPSACRTGRRNQVQLLMPGIYKLNVMFL